MGFPRIFQKLSSWGAFHFASDDLSFQLCEGDKAQGAMLKRGRKETERKLLILLCPANKN
jgi:hypothetical protein